MDVLLTDVDIITMAAGGGPAASMLVRDGRIAAAGPAEQVRAAAAADARVGCRPSRSLYSTYPLPVTHDSSGVRVAASRNRARIAGMSGAAGWLQSAPDAR